MIVFAAIKLIAYAASAYGGYSLWEDNGYTLWKDNDASSGRDVPPAVAGVGISAAAAERHSTVPVPSREQLLHNNEGHLKLAALSCATAVGGTVFAAPLMLTYSVGLISVALWPRFVGGARKFFDENRISGDLIYVALVPISVLTGQSVGMSIAAGISIIGDRFKIKTEDQFRTKLSEMLSAQFDEVWLQTSSGATRVPMSKIRFGDVVVIHTGEIVPIDGFVVDGSAAIDQRVLTGESVAAEKVIGDKVFASTLVVAGRVCVKVDKSGAETAVAQLASVLDDTIHYTTRHVESQSVQRTDAQSPWVLVGGGMTALIGGLYPATSLMSSWTPGRMRITSGLTMLNYMQVAAQHGVLIKDGRALEQLRDVDVVLFDKTGTLTEDLPSVHEIHAWGHTPEEVLRYAAGAEAGLTHPLARAIQKRAADDGLLIPAGAGDEAAYELGYGIRMLVEGTKVRLGSAAFMSREGIRIPAKVKRLAEDIHLQGHSIIYVALGSTLAGVIEMRSTIRPEAAAVIAALRASGVPHLSILSGDHEAPTAHLAAELGFDSYCSSLLPQGKSDYIKALQAAGKVVCFIGDGINDSLALKQAQVGISMTGASRIATETAQVVLMDPNLSAVTTVFQISHDLRRSIDQDSILSSWIPGAIGSGLALFAGVGVAPILVLHSVFLAVGMANASRPLTSKQAS